MVLYILFTIKDITVYVMTIYFSSNWTPVMILLQRDKKKIYKNVIKLSNLRISPPLIVDG